MRDQNLVSPAVIDHYKHTFESPYESIECSTFGRGMLREACSNDGRSLGPTRLRRPALSAEGADDLENLSERQQGPWLPPRRPCYLRQCTGVGEETGRVSSLS